MRASYQKCLCRINSCRFSAVKFRHELTAGSTRANKKDVLAVNNESELFQNLDNVSEGCCLTAPSDLHTSDAVRTEVRRLQTEVDGQQSDRQSDNLDFLCAVCFINQPLSALYDILISSSVMFSTVGWSWSCADVKP